MAKKAATEKVTKESKSKKDEEKIVIPPILIKKARITIVGTTPLLVNRFDEKSKQQIEDSYRGVAKNKKQPRTAKEEYEASLYYMPGKKTAYGIPASGIKKCAVSACRFVDGVSMTVAKGAFHILGEAGGLVPVKSSGPVMDERMVRVGTFGNKKPAMRRRGRFDDWSVTFTVAYNEGVLNLDQLLNLYENAGFSVGLCEYRPEKDGDLGLFTVKRA